jgi:DNA mismatch repair protein MutS2
MTAINDFSTAAQAVDFGPLLKVVATFSTCPLGREALHSLQPQRELDPLRHEFARVNGAITLLQQGASPTLAGLEDDREMLATLAAPFSWLDGTDFVRLAGNLGRLAKLRAQLLTAGEPLKGEAGASFDGRPLHDAIEKILDPEGNVRDDASPALKKLRRQRHNLYKEINALLKDELKKHADDLMEQLLVERNGRLVLPVKSGRRRAISGITHGVSGTGHTVFIEPERAVAVNNEAEALLVEENLEIRRLLIGLGDQCRESNELLQALYAQAGDWDGLFARARFALACDASLPPLAHTTQKQNEAIVIRGGRHPLLDERLRDAREFAGLSAAGAERVIPISLEIRRDRPLLLISGPNAGGKTAALKLLGLFALMQQCAIPLPAEAGTTLPLFARLHTDIGEDQSLLTSLSTFSARMTHLAKMLADLPEPSLALLDELGTGTDPDEGTALAKAALLALLEQGAWVAASTHFDELKAFALSHARMRCAAALFDEATLQPLYRLDFDHPGRSYGLEVAARSGVPAPVIARARELLDPEHRALAQMLHGLEEKIAAAEREHARLQQEAGAQREAAARKLQSLEKQFSELRSQYDQLLGEALTETQNRPAAVKKVKGKLAALEGQAVRTGLLKPAAPPRQYQPGDRVKDRRFGVEGIVIGVKGDKIALRSGAMKMESSPKDLQFIESGAVVSELPKPAVSISTASTRGKSTGREINLLGKYVDEGIAELEKYLDDALRSGWTVVRVVHGHGTGRLKEAVRNYLRGAKFVASFTAAPQNEGGDGATLVTLDV